MRVRNWIITAAGAGGLAIGLAGPAMASTHVVQPGDTLSGIAAESGVSLASVEKANPWIKNFNLIYVGQRVNVPDGRSGITTTAPAPVAPSAPAPAPAPSTGTSPAASSDTTTPASSDTTSSAGTTATAPVSTGAPGSFQQCVAWRESGDNPTASSAGLYGILPSTWASLGLPGTAEQASVAQQSAAFQELYAQDGTSPWAPYDGC